MLHADETIEIHTEQNFFQSLPNSKHISPANVCNDIMIKSAEIWWSLTLFDISCCDFDLKLQIAANQVVIRCHKALISCWVIVALPRVSPNLNKLVKRVHQESGKIISERIWSKQPQIYCFVFQCSNQTNNWWETGRSNSKYQALLHIAFLPIQGMTKLLHKLYIQFQDTW